MFTTCYSTEKHGELKEAASLQRTTLKYIISMEIPYCNENYGGHLLFDSNAANLLKILKCVKILDLHVYSDYPQTTKLFRGPYFICDL
jgi:hypothetical protein